MLRKSALSKSIASAVPLAVMKRRRGQLFPHLHNRIHRGRWGRPIVTGWLLGYSDGGSLTDSIASY